MPSNSQPVLISDDTLITRNDGVLATAVQDETVIMHVASGHYYGLDDIGSVIWQRIEQPCRFGTLIDALVAEYDGDRALITEDVRKLLSIMAEHSVILLT